MRVFKFNLSGNAALFTRPHTNYVDFTFTNIHRPALLGMLGAILGLSGLASKTKEEDYPEFYQKLKTLKVAIVPCEDNFEMKVFKFTNTTGHSSDRGTQIVDQRVLINPSWEIYLSEDSIDADLFKLLKTRLENQEAHFIPFLGKNHFRAEFGAFSTMELTEVVNVMKIDSLFPKRKFAIQESFDFGDYKFEKNEELPFAYKAKINHYIEETMVHTNKAVIRRYPEEKVFTDGINFLYFW